jgi:ubiquinone/menaquinone biosynthesis C-methylase UbiE
MNRAPMKHERVFYQEDEANRYARQHQKMAEQLSREYGEKLHSRGFQSGRIIDVGCGSGAVAIMVAQEFPDSEVLGVDLSDPLLYLANQAAQAAGVSNRVRFEKRDVERMPYQDNSFDAVLNLNMVHVVEHPIQMLNEIERLLSPDGCAFVADLRRSWLGLFEKEMKSAFTLKEAQEIFGQSNLREGSFSSNLIWWKFEA